MEDDLHEEQSDDHAEQQCAAMVAAVMATPAGEVSPFAPDFAVHDERSAFGDSTGRGAPSATAAVADSSEAAAITLSRRHATTKKAGARASE